MIMCSLTNNIYTLVFPLHCAARAQFCSTVAETGRGHYSSLLSSQVTSAIRSIRLSRVLRIHYGLYTHDVNGQTTTSMYIYFDVTRVRRMHGANTIVGQGSESSECLWLSARKTNVDIS